MNIYLDIDGVLLYEGKVANGATEFLKFVTSSFDVFWLTTHCKGDPQTAVEYMKRFGLDIPELNKIQPTNWDVLKTETINLLEPFLWFEDNPLLSEVEYLKSQFMNENLVFVDLKRKPDQLLDLLNDFPLPLDF